eukprot:9395736-Pyramimonas_sp.AAC.1
MHGRNARSAAAGPVRERPSPGRGSQAGSPRSWRWATRPASHGRGKVATPAERLLWASPGALQTSNRCASGNTQRGE